jgi:3-methyl-2-oxobutanoate hydroxymethyltransferase
MNPIPVIQKKRNTGVFRQMKLDGTPIVWITAYDAPMATAAEVAGVDLILVGDSGGMVQLGYTSTTPVTMDEMITMTAAARRGAPSTFIVGDMPLGSYEISDASAIENAVRFVKAGADAIKLEGGARIASRVAAIASAGISVFGHIGLTPQSSAGSGGYRVQGKSVDSLNRLVGDLEALEAAGVSATLLEAVPAAIGRQVAKRATSPVLGIGAGRYVDGQLLVIGDLLGIVAGFRPKFAKCFVPLVLEEFQRVAVEAPAVEKSGSMAMQDGLLMLSALAIHRYAADVRSGSFPDSHHEYPLTGAEETELRTSANWLA